MVIILGAILCLYPSFCFNHTIQGRTELHDAAERGDVKQVQRLLSTSVNINSMTKDVSIAIWGNK